LSNFYLIAALIISLELIRVLKINTLLKNYLLFMKKIFFLIKLKQTSDHWKKKFILIYSTKLSYFFLKLLLSFLLAFFPLIVVFLIGKFIYEDILLLFYDYRFYLLSTIFAFIYLKIRNKFDERKLFHN